MCKVQIIGRELSSKEELYKILSKELELPDYFGENLDALYDVLTEIREDVSLEVSLNEMTDESFKKYMEMFWRMLCDAADENPFLQISRIR